MAPNFCGTKAGFRALIEHGYAKFTRGKIDWLMVARYKSLALMTLLALLAGCGSQITIEDPTIPEPLIDKLTLKVVARYPEEFDNYSHQERTVGKEKWGINLGASNKLLFTQLFDSMFTDFEVIGHDVDARGMDIDALIEPSIDAFDFSVPNQSQTDEFAVWIRYRIKIFDKDGVQIANWPISAYGKALATTFGSDAALRRAAVLAMRDAAALIIMQMDKSTGISQLALARNEPQATVPSVVDDEMQAIASEEPPR